MAEKEKLALYRLWRPQTFDDVVAQKQVVYPLQQSVVEGTFSHALLFSGTRGTGKTSLAKIFAKAINCLDPKDGNPCNVCDICRAINHNALMDISEIDAASHNSVEDIRRLTDEIMFTPVRARYKVYIIDEAHMLSSGAFNALLKTLEEPPEHAVFVLATTEPHRIPATIISRCQHYKFRRIPNDAIAGRLSLIARDIGLDITDDALETIAYLSAGALRDAISLLDQTRQIAKRPVERDDVLDIAGRVPDEFLSETASALLFKNYDQLLTDIQNIVLSGRDLTRFVTDLGEYFRHLLVSKVAASPEKLILLRDKDVETLRAVAAETSTSTIIAVIEGLAELLVSMRFTPDLRTTLEISLLRLASKYGRAENSEAVSKPPAPKATASSRPGVSRVAEKANGLLVSEPAETTLRKNEDAPGDGADVSPEIAAEDTKEATDAPPSPPGDREQQAPERDAAHAESAGAPRENTVATPRGEERLLDVWSSVLETLQQEQRVEVALCARPARVSFSDGVINLHFGKNLTGQCACLSKDDNRQEIEHLLSERIGRPVQCTVTLDDDGGKKENAVEAIHRMARLRGHVAPIDDLPAPDAAEGSRPSPDDVEGSRPSPVDEAPPMDKPREQPAENADADPGAGEQPWLVRLRQKLAENGKKPDEKDGDPTEA